MYDEVWEAIRREEEEMAAFPQVDIKSLVAESGRAYREEYVRRHSPAVEEEDSAWAKEMTAMLWRLAMKTRNPVRETVIVGLLAALPLLPCMLLSYYLVIHGGTQSRLGLRLLFATAGLCFITSIALFIGLRRRVMQLGIPRFNATFNSRTFWGIFGHTGGGYLAGSVAALLIAILTPQLLNNVDRQRAQDVQGSVREFRDSTQSYEEAALDLAEKQTLASIEKLQDPAAASTITEGETNVVHGDKALSVKTVKPTPKVIKSNISASNSSVPVIVSTQATPFEAAVYSTTPGGRSALLIKFLVGKVDGFKGDKILITVSGDDDTTHTRAIQYDTKTLGRIPVGEKKVFIIDATGSVKAFKELTSDSSQRGATAPWSNISTDSVVAKATQSAAVPTP